MQMRCYDYITMLSLAEYLFIKSPQLTNDMDVLGTVNVMNVMNSKMQKCLAVITQSFNLG